jgi:hypothetical protein
MTTEDKIPLIAIYSENSNTPDGVAYRYRVVTNMLCSCCQKPLEDELCETYSGVLEYLQERFREFGKPNGNGGYC